MNRSNECVCGLYNKARRKKNQNNEIIAVKYHLTEEQSL